MDAASLITSSPVFSSSDSFIFRSVAPVSTWEAENKSERSISLKTTIFIASSNLSLLSSESDFLTASIDDFIFSSDHVSIVGLPQPARRTVDRARKAVIRFIILFAERFSMIFRYHPETVEATSLEYVFLLNFRVFSNQQSSKFRNSLYCIEGIIDCSLLGDLPLKSPYESKSRCRSANVGTFLRYPK